MYSKQEAKEQKQKVAKKIEKRKQKLNLPENIEDIDEYKSIAQTAVQIKKAKKYVENTMDNYARPYYDVYKKIRGFFKPEVEKLDDMEGKIKEKMSEFVKRKNKKIEEENEQRKQKAIEESDKTMVEVEQKDKVKTEKTKEGKVQPREKVDYTIEDKSKLPAEYTKVKVKKRKLRKAVKNGEDIPGVEVEKDYNLAIYTND